MIWFDLIDPIRVNEWQKSIWKKNIKYLLPVVDVTVAAAAVVFVVLSSQHMETQEDP